MGGSGGGWGVGSKYMVSTICSRSGRVVELVGCWVYQLRRVGWFGGAGSAFPSNQPTRPGQGKAGDKGSVGMKDGRRKEKNRCVLLDR
jgi:hypothetical protein